MTEPRTHHRIVRNRKKSRVPLSKLRTSDAVKTVVAHPRRLQELLRMLEDKDICVRGRAAMAMAHLSDSHPARLIRVAVRLREALADDSAYVRWHILYTFGQLGVRFLAHSRLFLPELIMHLDDENRVCRIIACRGLGQVARRKPSIVEECFNSLKKDIPPALTRLLSKS
jgi:hypothetical protein